MLTPAYVTRVHSNYYVYPARAISLDMQQERWWLDSEYSIDVSAPVAERAYCRVARTVEGPNQRLGGECYCIGDDIC